MRVSFEIGAGVEVVAVDVDKPMEVELGYYGIELTVMKTMTTTESTSDENSMPNKTVAVHES